MAVWTDWQLACVLQVEYEYGEVFSMYFDHVSEDPGYLIDFSEAHLTERYVSLVMRPFMLQIPSNPL